MGKARPITIDTRNFAKAGDASSFFSAMLNHYSMNATVSAADAADLSALLKLHDEYSEKIGAGIDHFEVRKPPQDVPDFSHRCFWIVRTDGSSIDFSFKHCLEASRRTP